MKKPVMLERLSDIDVVALDAAVALGLPGERALRLLKNRHSVAPEHKPVLLLLIHNSSERDTALRFVTQARPFCQDVMIVEERNRSETAANALASHHTFFPEVSMQERKQRVLLLGRRGGKGKPEFIAPFIGGQGTTCGAWTPVVAYKRGSTTWIAGTRPKSEEAGAMAIRGFLRGNYAQGVCPADCSFCYLRGLQGMGIKQVMLNLEDCIAELDVLPKGSVVNWAELGGPVEQDPWFVDDQGRGSLMQTILDLSTQRGVVSFFLTKGKYEPYLELEGRLALFAISLNAPTISSVFEPGGATPEERLQGLAWAMDHGLMDHTIRLGPIIPVARYESHYRELFAMMRDILGARLKRITVDLLRFSPQMPSILKASFSEEISSVLLSEMESEVKAHKYRSSADRQLQQYQWIRVLLAEYGMPDVAMTPCKADPGEAHMFLKAGAITSMPCACHISYQNRERIRQSELPVLSTQIHLEGNV